MTILLNRSCPRSFSVIFLVIFILLSNLMTFNFAAFANDSASPSRPICGPLIIQSNRHTYVKIGYTWSGVGTEIGSLILDNGNILVGYYDEERWFILAEVDYRNKTICKKKLDSRFSGWDAHNYITIKRSSDGAIHVAGNMHAAPLIYARSNNGHISSFSLVSMIGKDEARISYPRFFQNGAGGLFFLYRSGGSGDGAWIVNQWQREGWKRIGEIFGRFNDGATVSAYPTEFTSDANGVWHVAIVWRSTPDVASNFVIGYAKTKNFLHWQKSNGSMIAGVLSPTNMHIIDRTGNNMGLLNNHKLILDKYGAPIVIYSKYGIFGNNSIFSARVIDGNWSNKELFHSTKRTAIEGWGALPLPAITINPRDAENAIIRAFFPPAERMLYRLFPNTLEPKINTRPSRRSDDASIIDKLITPSLKRSLADVTIRRSNVRASNDVESSFRLEWFAQGPNGDKPRECTNATPLACDPPASPLILMFLRAVNP